MARSVTVLGVSGLAKDLPSLFPAALAAINDASDNIRRLANQVRVWEKGRSM